MASWLLRAPTTGEIALFSKASSKFGRKLQKTVSFLSFRLGVTKCHFGLLKGDLPRDNCQKSTTVALAMKPLFAAFLAVIGSALFGLALIGLLSDAARIIPFLPGSTASAFLLLPATFLIVVGLRSLKTQASAWQQATTQPQPRWLRAVELFTFAASVCLIVMVSHGLVIRLSGSQQGRPLIIELLVLVAGIANGWRSASNLWRAAKSDSK